VLGKTPAEMQVGCAWAAAGLLSYGLGGVLTVLGEDGKVLSSQYGHNRPVSTMVLKGGKLLAGSFEDAISPLGVVRVWDLATGLSTPFKGADGTQKGGHTSMVIKMAVRASGEVVTIGRDDTFLVSSADGVYGIKTPLEAAPIDMGCGAALAAIITNTKELKLTKAAAIETTVPLQFEPTVVAVSPSDALVAVGADANDHAIYTFDSKGVTKGIKLERHRGPISCLAYSPDSTKLASGCANKELVIWSASDGAPLVTGLSGFHTTRLACLAWSPNGSLASGGVDSTIFVWTPATLKDAKPHSTAKLTHTSGGVNALVFVAEDSLASAGADACIKFWKIDVPVDLS